MRRGPERATRSIAVSILSNRKALRVCLKADHWPMDGLLGDEERSGLRSDEERSGASEPAIRSNMNVICL
jgi:hypothetical protein